MKNLHVLYSVKLEKIFASSVENRQKLIFNNKTGVFCLPMWNTPYMWNLDDTIQSQVRL